MKWALLLVAGLCLAGCMEAKTTVKVNKDGSGTITQTLMMGGVAVAQMKGMAASQENAPEFNLYDEAKVRESASKLGEGVEFVSGKKTEDGKGGEGFEAVFKFADVSKVKISQNMMPETGMGGPQPENKDDLIKLSFAKGSPAVLTIVLPNTDEAIKKASAGKPDVPEQQVMQMKQMFKGMKIELAVEVEGPIVETNAIHKDGNEITLMAMDFDKLMADNDKFLKLMTAKPETLAESKELIKDMDGIKAEMAEIVTVKF